MTTDFRALCAELHAAFNTYAVDQSHHELLQRARAALPEPESPLALGEIDLAQRARAIVSHWDNHPGSPDSSGNLKAGLTGSPADDELAALATTELVRQLRTKAATEKANRCHYSAKLLTRAADLLERLIPPLPVPVSERLPGPEDLHPTEQWCWACGQDCCAWHRVTRHFDAWSYWLPAHALPTPTIESE